MNHFTFMQKWRNKIRVNGSVSLDIASTAKLVNCKIEIKGANNTFSIEENSVLRDTQIEILGDNSSIIIGKNCIVGHDCYLSAKESTTLKIGDECMLSRNVKIMTSDGHPIYQNNECINSAKSIRLGHKVWCGDNVTILKGVLVGDGCVVGINATLTRSIPLGVIAVGNPAKVVKENVIWKE